MREGDLLLDFTIIIRIFTRYSPEYFSQYASLWYGSLQDYQLFSPAHFVASMLAGQQMQTIGSWRLPLILWKGCLLLMCFNVMGRGNWLEKAMGVIGRCAKSGATEAKYEHQMVMGKTNEAKKNIKRRENTYKIYVVQQNPPTFTESHQFHYLRDYTVQINTSICTQHRVSYLPG